MEWRKVFIGVTFLIFAATFAWADVIYLKNGSVIKGEIIETIPDKSYKVRTADGNIFIFAVDKVEKVEFKAREIVPAEEARAVKAEERPAQGKMGVGLNYPGASIKYLNLPGKWAVELKGQFGDDIVVVGPRGYYYFSSAGKAELFCGLEADYISFKGDNSEGSGLAGEVFVGGEYFVTPNLTIELDFGPAYISLKDSDTKEEESVVEYVVNAGITYYFGGGGQR